MRLSIIINAQILLPFSEKGTQIGICAHLSKTQHNFGIYASGESNQPVSQDLVFEPFQLQNLGELYGEHYYSIILLERGRKKGKERLQKDAHKKRMGIRANTEFLRAK